MTQNPNSDLLSAFLLCCNELPKGVLFTDVLTCTLYASDASMYQIQPLAVLIPQNMEQVYHAVRAALKVKMPIIGRGSGTSLAGQAIGCGLVIDFSKHLDRILHFDPAKRQITVEPGLVLDDLNRFLSPHGLLFGPDPASASRATLGGMTATNATGTHSIAYGSVVDHLVSAKLILQDGSVITLQELDQLQVQDKQKQGDTEGNLYQKILHILYDGEAIIRRDTPKHWRRQGGYRVERLLEQPFNLAKLLCGAEGTLGIVTEITLSLVEKPPHTAMAIVHFDDRMKALQASPALLEIQPYAIEMLDHHALERCRDVSDYAHRLSFVVGKPDALLMVEVIGDDAQNCVDKLNRIKAISESLEGCFALTFAQTSSELTNVREVRKAGLGLVMGVKGALKPLPFIEDAAVPVQHLAAYIERLEGVLRETQTEATIYGHASAGCLHVRPYVNPQTPEGLERMKRLALASAMFAKEYQGVISSEHGDGLVRGWLAESFYGPELYAVYRALKQAFDPQNLFNPGKKTDSPPFTENLRLASYTKPINVPLAFPEEGRMEAATELCNGAGVCRKLHHGAMCPSFRATRDELHSTRGRANALRAAFSGNSPIDGPELKMAMDLCISCKACKAECPSSVDMAKLKLAWQTLYYQTHKIPFRERMLAAVPRFAPYLSGRFAPIANYLAQNKLIRQGLFHLAGIAPDVPLPSLSTNPFRAKKVQNQPDLILFADTFNTYFSPEVTRDALWLFEKMGLRTKIITRECCGRTHLSKGLIEPMLKKGKHLLDQLSPFAAQNLPIVGLEPSCILTLKDEYPALFPNHPAIEFVAHQSMTFDRYLSQPTILKRLIELNWPQNPLPLWIHAHCHQKAIEGSSAIKQLFQALPQLQVTIADTGCCGMAGAFGYEAEHTNLSLKIAEEGFLPKIKKADHATLVACGTSCQHQISRTTGKQALHTAQILSQWLRSSK